MQLHVKAQGSKDWLLLLYIRLLILTGDTTLKKMTSNYWTVFGVVSALIICLILEVSIVNVSGFSNPHNSATDIPIFSALGVFSIISQLIILNFVYTKNVPYEKSILRIMNKAMVLTQLAIIIILVIILIEINFMLSYYLVHLELVFMISSIIAVGVMGLLSYKFITWLRLNKNRITLAYLFASLSLSINAIIGMIYVADQFNYVADVIQPKPYGGFIMHSHYSSLADLYTISSGIAFVLFWLGTVLLLQSYRKRLGAIKFWIIMLVPLLYFLSQFQPLVISMLFNYTSGNPMLYSTVYVLMLEVSTPIGGILFGLAFMIVARKIQNAKVKGYLVISGIGLLFLLISYRPQEIITGPFPPFGLLSASFMGMASFLVFIGIYSAAISVSQDSVLRQSIRKIALQEASFLDAIGTAEMEQKIERRAVNVAKEQQGTLTQQTGIQSSLTESDMKQYVSEVLKEIHVLQNIDEILSKGKEILETSTEFLVCSKAGGIRLVYNNYFGSYEKIMQEYSKGKHKGIRLVISIDRDSIDIVQKFLSIGVHVKHVKNMPPIDFAVSDKEMVASIEGEVKNLLVSTEQPYIDHFTSIFNELWKSGIDAKDRIKAIEEGIDTEGIEIIQNPAEIQKIIFDLLKSAREEILVIFSSANAFHRQEYLGATQFLKDAANERGVKARILTPKDDLIVQTTQRWMEQQSQQNQEQQLPNQQKINIRFIEPYLQTKVSLLIVDREFSLAVELKDDAAQKSYEAMGLATYSNSKPTVLSYVSIFENLWRQNELYQQVKEANEQLELANEKLKIHDKIQQEFINIAAHELKTPIQPILGLSEVVLSRTKDVEQAKLLEVINRNAQRLHRLTEDILDVTRIESKSLHLRKERFNLIEMINSAITDSKGQIKKEYKDNIKLESIFNEDVFIKADRNRIYQVILNLLSNAIKFTKEGTIVITAAAEEKNGNNEVIVSVKDTGQGIDSEILPRLFTKFATKSETGGTGLGLFISKSIVEAHGGKIWAENNADGKGATFSFSLPIINK
jgi:signal transduction histidine kinase